MMLNDFCDRANIKVMMFVLSRSYLSGIYSVCIFTLIIYCSFIDDDGEEYDLEAVHSKRSMAAVIKSIQDSRKDADKKSVVLNEVIEILSLQITSLHY